MTSSGSDDRDDLLWMVGHLLGDCAALPRCMFRLADEAAAAYVPGRYTLDYWEPSDDP